MSITQVGVARVSIGSAVIAATELLPSETSRRLLDVAERADRRAARKRARKARRRARKAGRA